MGGAMEIVYMAISEEIFRDAMALPPDARAELTERLVESLAQDISPEITSAQLAEVRRRVAQVESGEVELIPGDEAWPACEVSSRSIFLAPYLTRSVG